jgi:predicted RNA-binding Zn-ribbon protein involved in translation (DUF1610 family)
MTTVKCPNCERETEINIAKAVDDEGEVFMCEHCGFTFRYAPK